MKKLKLFVLSLFIFTFSLKPFAQTFEIKAGANFSTMFFNDEIGYISSKDYQMVPRLLFGVAAEFPLAGSFSYETGLLFSSKGYKLDTFYPVPNYQGEYAPVYDNTTLNYIEIPLLLKASAKLKNLPVLFTLGPYFGMGLNGKAIRSIYNWEKETSERKTFKNQFGKDSNWKRPDYGLQAGAGVEIQNIVLKLHYSYGLANISQMNSITAKNRAIGLTLGYKFFTTD
jgi:hypothetical protein